MNTKVLLAAALILILAPSIAGASSVTRYLPESAYPGEKINVTLGVSVTGESYYLIDEAVPSGWAIIPQAADTEAGHVKWAVIQNAASTSYTYEVRAPQAEGTYTFSGKYMFEGMKLEGSIGGQQSITVRADESLLVLAVIIASIAISVALYILKSRR